MFDPEPIPVEVLPTPLAARVLEELAGPSPEEQAEDDALYELFDEAF
jgi:hypothetical protein